jgi:hypothetical protein
VLKWILRGVLGVAYLALCIYAVTTETGPIGWLNYAQQSLFGAYSQKLTMLVAIVVSVLVLAPLWRAIDALARRMGIADRLPDVRTLTGADVPVTNRGLLWACVVVIALIWAGGYVIYWWIEHQHREDAAAHYEPVELGRGSAAPTAAGPYLALRGRLLWERTVTLTTSSSSTPEYTLVPLVVRDWRDGEPVFFVARVDNSNRYLAERSSRSGEVILARTDGQVAVPAAQEFAKMKVAVRDATVLLRLVPSEQGVPALPDTAEGDWHVYLWLALGFSVLYLLMTGVMLLARQARERRLKKRR